jgi:hemerythrin superfamily protein
MARQSMNRASRLSQQNWFSMDWLSSFSARDALTFGAGAMIMLAASRLAPPVAGRAIGSIRAMAGTDPFEALAQDHQKALALFDRIEATEDSATARRHSMLLQLKRMLTAHALAEEDIVYPMLHDDAHRREQAKKLYREHAEVKVRLFELEHKAKGDPSWMEDLRALHRMVRDHAQEEETIEFPKLRAALDEARCTTLLGEVQREKSMLL